MKKNNYKDQARVGDYIIYCQQCAMPCWASVSQTLSKDTGKGGLIVCPTCVDAVDPGLIPYKIGPEKSLPKTSINQQNITDGSTIPDFTTFDPLSGDLPE